MKNRAIPTLSLAIAAMFAITLHSHDDVLHHWEIPSKDPDRIVLTLPGDPSTTIGITWRTNTEIAAGYVDIAKATGAPRFDLQSTRFEATTESAEFPKSKWNREFRVNYHSVKIEGLEPNTLYAYRVGDGDHFVSEWIQFRTAAAEPSPITFLYFGDAQNSVLSHWSRVIRAAYQKAPYADFALHAGDLINRAHRDTEWAEWFKAGGWIHASLPTIVVTGNHEYGDKGTNPLMRERFLSMHWQPQFNLPTADGLPEILDETVYSVEYPTLKIIVLNSNRERESQIEWLRQELESAGDKWTVVSFHHPVFSSGKDRDNKALRAEWKPILDEFEADLVLQGHDHTYARGQTSQIPQSTESIDESNQSIQSVYVNSVSGPKMYDFQKDGWDRFSDHDVSLLKKAENTQFFQVITVDGNKLLYRAYTAAGDLYDAFTVTKDELGKKSILQETPSKETRLFQNTEKYDREGMPY
jgi:hypothetical protein